ncbi:PREDICTED: GDSL [Prunus dulcis]|uniref:PREDICTED: GDSL n=1 Tax=Prunus dulcis TaxID=3755 RepID=A0A5E4G8T9_PRUDU|nr:GDSL esterase/lipase At2g27360-like [Prunus dulcis]XP_034213132.1 GDSL esterase/lipase At2g27360-like [Prunus dulcis]VVA36083.1 PREDICTED: GDSL [Prunus dulcis]
MSSMGWSFQAYLMNLILVSVIIIPLVLGCYNSIIGFGDSITDTGNLYNSDPNRSLNFFHPPYGETYFHHPTGRCSDGRLVIDFIAEFLGLPLVPPYLESLIISNQSVQNFEAGVNFAVAGATALDAAFLEEMGDSVSCTNDSLSIQLEWFKQMLPSLCNTSSDCNKVLSTSLILMGEIGGNDYNDALLAGKSIEKVQAYVPLVIETIASTINELIELGAATLLVPGNFPIGCLPAYLTTYESSDKNQYDPSTGCLNWLNKFSGYHNDQLQLALSRIRRLHPQVAIIYADYYNAMLQLYQSPDQFGFIGETSKACCGGGGPYNYNTSALCGDAGASACENPAQFISWDGLHSTEAAYRWITKAILQGNYTVPRVSTLCDSPV